MLICLDNWVRLYKLLVLHTWSFIASYYNKCESKFLINYIKYLFTMRQFFVIQETASTILDVIESIEWLSVSHLTTLTT